MTPLPGSTGSTRGQIASGTLSSGYTLTFADINGDTLDDCLFVSTTTGSVQAWINNAGDPA
jgi:hypothetical protein